MSFFRRRTFSLSRRPRDRTPRNEVESVSPKPEQESVDFSATNLRLADADSQLYIVINFPAWEGCVVKYPDPGTAAKLMKNLQMVSTDCDSRPHVMSTLFPNCTRDVSAHSTGM